MKVIICLLFSLYISVSFGQTFDWVQTISQGGNNHVWDMVSMPDGTIYATGRCKFSVIFGRGSTSIPSAPIGDQTDTYLFKLNPDSTVAWVKRMGGIYPDWGRGICLGPDNHLYLTGEFCNYAVFENDTIYGYDNGATDPFAMARTGYVAKYTLNGDLVWVRDFQGGTICKGYAVSADSLGNCYVTGVINGLTDFGNGVIAGENTTVQFGFIAKYDSNGNCVYATHIDGSTGSVGNDIEVISNNRISLTGSYKGTLVYDGQSFPGTSITWGDMYAMVVDSSANLIWNRTANSPFLVVGNGIKFDKSNNVYVSGTFTYTTNFDGVPYTYTGTGSTSSTINANADGFIVKYNEQGDQIWVKTFQNDAMVSMEHMCVDGENIIVGGQISDTLFFTGNDTLTVPGNTLSGFLIAIDTSSNYLWSKIVKGSAPSPYNYTRPIVYDSDHNVYIGGGFKGTGTWDHQYINAGANNDAYIVKMFPLINAQVFGLGNACVGDTILITSSAKGSPLSTNWSVSGNPTILLQNQDTLIYIPTFGNQSDTIIFIASNPYETDTASLVISIGQYPIVDLGGDTLLCEGDVLELQAGISGFMYNWGAGFVADDSSYSVIIPGTYAVEVYNDPFCIWSDQIVVSSGILPDIELGMDTSFCTGDSLMLDAGSNSVWFDWGSGYVLNDSIKVVYSSGTFSVTALNSSGCTNFDEIIISTYNIPDLNLGSDTAICLGELIILTAGSEGDSVSWGSGFNLNDTLQTVSSDGTYSAIVMNNWGCSSSDEIVITTNEVPFFELGPDMFMCDYDSTLMQAGSLNDSVNWGVGFLLNDTLRYLSGTGNYVVTVKNEFACVFSDSVLVTGTNCLGTQENLIIPAKIYPNPFNDLLHISFSDMNFPVEMVVRSAEGQLVYTATLTGEITMLDLSRLAKGFYQIEFISIENETHFFTNIIKL